MMTINDEGDRGVWPIDADDVITEIKNFWANFWDFTGYFTKKFSSKFKVKPTCV